MIGVDSELAQNQKVDDSNESLEPRNEGGKWREVQRNTQAQHNVEIQNNVEMHSEIEEQNDIEAQDREMWNEEMLSNAEALSNAEMQEEQGPKKAGNKSSNIQYERKR